MASSLPVAMASRTDSVSPPPPGSTASSPSPPKVHEPASRSGTPSQSNPILSSLGDMARPTSRNMIHTPQPPPTLSILGGPSGLSSFENRTQLFVGNLPFRVRWQDCKDLFRKCGTVLRADVALTPDNRSKGFGTVLFASREDAQRAVDTYAGFVWQSRVLDVRIDQQDPHGIISMQMAAAQAQLPPHHAHLLAPHGMLPMQPAWNPMAYGMAPPGPPYAGVPFPTQGPPPAPQRALPRSPPQPGSTPLSPDAAKTSPSPEEAAGEKESSSLPPPPTSMIVNGSHGPMGPPGYPGPPPPHGMGPPHPFYGQPMMVPTPVIAGPNGQFYIMSPYYGPPMSHMGHYPPSNRHSPAPAFANRTLFVGNLPFSAAWQELKDLMRTAGNVQRADVTLGPDGRSRGFGTVVFASPDDAQNAVRMFNGFEWQGRTLKVHFDKYSQPGSVHASPMMHPSHGPPMPMHLQSAPLGPSQLSRQGTNMSANDVGAVGGRSESTETNSPPPLTPLASPMYTVPPFLPGPIGPPHPFALHHYGGEGDEGPKLGSAALMSPPLNGHDRDPFSHFAMHQRSDTNTIMPHSIQIPTSPPLFGPMSPSQGPRGVPMTPSMPAFSFGAFPATPPLHPQFLSPGLGPYSPPLAIGGIGGFNGQAFNRSAFLNAAPGAPVHIGGQTSFSSFGSYFPDMSMSSDDAARSGAEADIPGADGNTGEADEPSYFPSVSSLLARRASSNLLAKDVPELMTLTSPKRPTATATASGARSASDGRPSGANETSLEAPSADPSSISAPTTALATDFDQRMVISEEPSPRRPTEAANGGGMTDSLRRRASFFTDRTTTTSGLTSAPRHVSGSGIPKALVPIRVEARAKIAAGEQSPRRASFDVSDPAQARTLAPPAAKKNVWASSPWAAKPKG